MSNPYAIAWHCLLHVLENNIPLELWIAPIPDEHKKTMLERGRRYLEKRKGCVQQPLPFEEAENG